MYDPEGKALKRRVERRYLSQITSGCGKSWCRNPLCKNGRNGLLKDNGNDAALAEKAPTIAEAMPIAKPYVDGLLTSEKDATPLHFCTDEITQQRRSAASLLAAESSGSSFEKRYSFPWCIAALEAQRGDTLKASEWLENFAPSLEEEEVQRVAEP